MAREEKQKAGLWLSFCICAVPRRDRSLKSLLIVGESALLEEGTGPAGIVLLRDREGREDTRISAPDKHEALSP